MRLPALVLVFVAFTAYSVFVTVTEGYFGFVTNALKERWGMQVFLDLVIAITVAWTWLRHDAKQRGITAWPYQLATIPLGSIAVLAYLIHRELAGKKVPVPAAAG